MNKTLLRDKPLRRFIAEKVEALRACPNATEDIRNTAIDVLKSVQKLGFWEIARDDFPSLPSLPAFCTRPDGSGYSNIPIPPQYRQQFKGRSQRSVRWPGRGIAAWVHYLARVADQVTYWQSPPAPSTPGRPASLLDPLDALKAHQEAQVIVVRDVLFASSITMETVASEAARQRLKRDFEVFLTYLTRQQRTRIQEIDRATLQGFRNACRKMVTKGKVAIRTANGFLDATRRVLGWCTDFLEMAICPAYRKILKNLSSRDMRHVEAPEGRAKTKTVGVADTIAMPVETLRAWTKATKGNPFEWAVTMCSLNLAAGAKDLSNLRFYSQSARNPEPSVDMDRKLFITTRGKTKIARYTTITERNELAIPMMERTYEALHKWIAHRTELIEELSSRTALTKRLERAKECRRLQSMGLTQAKIAETVQIPLGTVKDMLRGPADLKEYAQHLASSGYSLDEIVDLTGLAKSTAFGYIQGVNSEAKGKPRPNRHLVVIPDPNRVFFVPSTGRPLVSDNDKTNYVRTLFNAICKRAGILREVDFLPKKGSDKPPPEPPPNAFVLPRMNGHYILRRTAATVAGMLGEVPERELQHFMGHKTPEMTRKYVLHPPADYGGARMTHSYAFTLTKSKDPIQVLDAFLDYVMNHSSNR